MVANRKLTGATGLGRTTDRPIGAPSGPSEPLAGAPQGAQGAPQGAQSASSAGVEPDAGPGASSAPASSQGSPGHIPALDYIAPDLRPLAVPIEQLQPAPGNARAHGERDLAALSESLRRFGQRRAVVAMRQYRGVVNAVIAGNGTLAAARRLRWSHLAVTWFAGTDDEARAYAIADNRTAELSSWDLSVLAGDLQSEGLDLGAWFSDSERLDLLASLGADAPDPGFAPAGADEQGHLDALGQRTCPTCGRPFAPEGEG